MNSYHVRHYIENQFVDSQDGSTFEILTPLTNEVIGHAASGKAEDVDRAVRAARAAFDRSVWSRLAVAERAKKVRLIGDLVRRSFTMTRRLASVHEAFFREHGARYDVAARLGGEGISHFDETVAWLARVLERRRELALLRAIRSKAGTMRDPLRVPVDQDGLAALDRFLEGLHADSRNAQGLEAAWLGKGAGVLPRLAAVLHLL